MEYLIGLGLAAGVGVLTASLGFDRDRSFAPTVLMVVATYYVLFALMGGSTRALVLEIAAATGFLLIGLIGFKTSPWVGAAAIAGHGVFDLVHDWFIADPGVPIWWPGFCMTFDVLFGAWLAVMLVRRKYNPVAKPA